MPQKYPIQPSIKVYLSPIVKDIDHLLRILCNTCTIFINLRKRLYDSRMRNTELIRAKEQAIYDTYKRGLEEGKFSSFRDAGEWVVRQPAPRFFIESRTISLLVGRIEQNISLLDLHSSSRRLVRQIYKNYRQYLADHPDCGLSRERIMEILVEEPAPEFYITGDAARRIIRKEVKRARESWEKKARKG